MRGRSESTNVPVAPKQGQAPASPGQANGGGRGRSNVEALILLNAF